MSAKPSLLRLYARILRLHRSKLPLPLRDMGDQYVREEFRSMWKLGSKAFGEHSEEFTQQWENYARTLTLPEEDARAGGNQSSETFGKVGSTTSGDLNESSLDNLSEEQRIQLKRLKDEIDGLSK